MMINEIKKTARTLGRDEMKKLRGGAAAEPQARCFSGLACKYDEANHGEVTGVCETNSAGKCVCNAGTSSVVWCECRIAMIIEIGNEVYGVSIC